MLTALPMTACGQGGDATATASEADTPAAAQIQATTENAAGATVPSERRTFRDWTAVCDNINNCTAYGPAEDNSGFVMLKLDAGPDATPRVHAGSWSLPTGSNRIALTIDGREFAGKMEALDEEDPVLTISNPSAQLIGALANGQAMTLAAGGETAGVSLSGAAAAFLWIDERQGRLGTTTALVRKGDRAASAVPAAPAAPRLAAAAASAQTNLPKSMPSQIAALPKVRECGEINQSGPAINEGWEVARLGSNSLLWSVPCGAGAYNFSQAYAISANDGSGARMLTFPAPGGVMEDLVNSNFDPSTNEISAFGKGRGIGDCGQMGSWVWTGREFLLKTEDVMENCLGVHWKYWPSTWRTAQ